MDRQGQQDQQLRPNIEMADVGQLVLQNVPEFRRILRQMGGDQDHRAQQAVGQRRGQTLQPAQPDPARKLRPGLAGQGEAVAQQAAHMQAEADPGHRQRAAQPDRGQGLRPPDRRGRGSDDRRLHRHGRDGHRAHGRAQQIVDAGGRGHGQRDQQPQHRNAPGRQPHAPLHPMLEQRAQQRDHRDHRPAMGRHSQERGHASSSMFSTRA